MLRITEIVKAKADPLDTLTLTFEHRQKSRQRVVLDSGDEAALYLPRGILLRGGDLLEAENGRIIRVIAARESTSTVTAKEPLLLMKACYHLGNRHIALQICGDFLRYRQDHVLDDMVIALGLNVRRDETEFEPETGAYHSHGH